jgi:hypothetical protein
MIVCVLAAFVVIHNGSVPAGKFWVGVVRHFNEDFCCFTRVTTRFVSFWQRPSSNSLEWVGAYALGSGACYG